MSLVAAATPAGLTGGLAFLLWKSYTACIPLSLRGRATELWC
jgi:hypothetical protein